MRFVSNHVSHAFSQKLENHGVTVAEWVVLRELYTVESTAPSDLAKNLSLTRGAISKLIDRLEAKSLVTRTFDETDRRFQSVALASAGRSLVSELARLADPNDDEFFGHLSERQHRELLNLLRGMVQRHELKGKPVS